MVLLSNNKAAIVNVRDTANYNFRIAPNANLPNSSVRSSNDPTDP